MSVKVKISKHRLFEGSVPATGLTDNNGSTSSTPATGLTDNNGSTSSTPAPAQDANTQVDQNQSQQLNQQVLQGQQLTNEDKVRGLLFNIYNSTLNILVQFSKANQDIKFKTQLQQLLDNSWDKLKEAYTGLQNVASELKTIASQQNVLQNQENQAELPLK